jgi:hypothetical protein
LEIGQKSRVRIALSEAVPGTTMIGTVVSRIGTTIIPITGITTTDSASFSSPSSKEMPEAFSEQIFVPIQLNWTNSCKNSFC